jgi:flagellin
VSFSINTNITSLQAQEYLRQTSNFQGTTLNRVTSGLRIIQSGDDAAGLAVANGYRSDEAVLSQGVRNANDGLSTLQTIDGGMSNISKLLDRARTLATQSASSTFTGNRNVLNSEFQSVMAEIDRQSQAIGMDKGGQFAKILSIFVGGGKGSTDASTLTNGSVGLDLTNSTVDTKSLGLNTYRAINQNYDLSATSATGVSKIIANQGKLSDGTTAITTAKFTFGGAGFGDSSGSTGQVDVTISTQGITDTAGLATAINNAIYSAANPGTATIASKAFKAAGITATIVTDSSGKQQLGFTSSSAAFQVHGDQLANAFMGNIADSRVSKVAGEGSTYIQGGSTLKTNTTSLGGTAYLTFTDKAGDALTSLNSVAAGAGVNGKVILADLTGTGISPQDAVDKINKDLDLAATYATGAGGTATSTSKIRAELKDGKLAFFATDGSEFNVRVTGDATDELGMVDNTNPRTAGTHEGSTVQTTAGVGDAGLLINYTATNIAFSDGTTDIASVSDFGDHSTTAFTGYDKLVEAINTKLANTKFRAEVDPAVSGGISFYSTDGSSFKVRSWDATNSGDVALGFNSGVTVTADAGASTGTASVYQTKSSQYQALTSGGVYQSTQDTSSGAYTNYSNSAYDFSSLGALGNNAQTITMNTKRADGSIVSLDIKLTGGASGNATNVTQAIDTINDSLQGSSDESLKGITAIRDQNGIRFIATQGFSLTLGDDDDTQKKGLSEVKDGAARQAGVQLDASTQGTGGQADISSQASASNAVAALGKAVQSLGSAQAVVGKGQNQFNYAVNLAQSQLSNLAAAESRIRDADLATEAANMTKAQILLQAGVAAMAQANSAPQQILSLLRG